MPPHAESACCLMFRLPREDQGLIFKILDRSLSRAAGVHRQPLGTPCQLSHSITSERPMFDVKQLSRSVKGLIVLVTGAASGMGRATAHVFAGEGAKVA